jgi:hypothetical protein
LKKNYQMKVVRENNEIKVSLAEIVSKSKATQKDADALANEINQSWWELNKYRFEK